MAYIPFTYAPMEKNTDKKYRYSLFQGGVKLSDKGGYIDEGKAERLCNFDILDGAVQTRNMKVCMSQNSHVQGEFHSAFPATFCGKIIMHAGTHLYALDNASDGFYEIYSLLPDAKSVICAFMSKLYIYCGNRIFSLDSEFNISEERPYAPLIYESVHPSTGDGIRTDEAYNLCAPIIKVRYDKNYYQPGDVFTTLKYPTFCDTAKPVWVYLNGEQISENDFTRTESSINIRRKLSGSDVAEVIFYTGWEYTDADDGFSRCSIAEAFGGNINGGTRLFITGNPQKKGLYYKSRLQDPLHFSADDTEVIGDGCEDITAMKRMYGDLIIFTKNSVFRMSYNPSYEISPFAVKEIGNGTGCDCPGSICLIDNRIVFLNSRKGVFTVDSTESTGEQNIKPISGNILSGHSDGLLDCDLDDLIGCYAIDFDRKYILAVGKRMYIWDYDKSPFRDSGNYASSQSRLIWYTYSFSDKCDFLYETDRDLICIEKSEYSVSCFYKGRTNAVTASFSSGQLDIGGSAKKQIRGINILFESFSDGVITLKFYADGREYCSKKINVKGGEKVFTRLKLPSKTLINLAFDLTSGAGIRVEEISFDYRNLK